MEEYLNRPARTQPEASSSQDTSSSLPLLQLSSPPPPTAREKGKGKAKLIGDVYDVYLAPSSINPCVRKPRLSNQDRSFCYQDDMFVRDKVDVAGKYAARSSPVWRLGEAVHRQSSSSSVIKYYCYCCERDNRQQALFDANGGYPLRHLVSVHGYDKLTNRCDGSKKRLREEADETEDPVDDSTDVQGGSQPTRQQRFRKTLVNFVIHCHVAFYIIEDDYFRCLIEFSGVNNRDLLPRSSRTLRSWIMSEFIARRRGLMQELKEAASSISISFDVWTSPSMTPILGIYSHFITSKGVRRRVLLGLKEIQGRHTAKTLALVLEATLIEYGIKHRLGYTMSDNASTNDACVEALTLICCPKLRTRAMRDRRRLRCFGHVVNLSAQAFTRGNAANDKALQNALKEIDKPAEAIAWRNKGSLGKMRNNITWFRGSGQRKQQFGETKVADDSDNLQVSWLHLLHMYLSTCILPLYEIPTVTLPLYDALRALSSFRVHHLFVNHTNLPSTSSSFARIQLDGTPSSWLPIAFWWSRIACLNFGKNGIPSAPTPVSILRTC